MMANGSSRACRMRLAALFFLVVVAIIGAEAKACPKGSAPNALGVCTKCRDNQYSPGGANAKCTRCADGTTPNAANSACTPCLRTFYGVNGTCRACPKGTYTSEQGAVGESSCVSCGNYTTGIGFTLPQSTCGNYIVCGPSIVSFKKACATTACWNNTEQCCQDKKTGKCINTLIAACPKGRGIDRTDGRCKPCAGGYYNDGSSPFRCKPCPAGTQAIGSRTWCDPCGPLKFSPGGSQCRPCPKGTYSDTVRGLGAKKCTRCTKRTLIPKWSSTNNCSDFIVCQPGKFPRIGRCGPRQCFNNKKKCCVRKGDLRLRCLRRP